MRLTRTPASAFALAELLVVAAMGVILIAVLVPALQHTKAQEHGVTCKGNLRALARVWQMYTADHDGEFMPGDGLGWARGEWVEGLRIYWKGKESMLLCPSATERRVMGDRETAWGSHDRAYIQGGYRGDDPVKTSYGYNLWMLTLPKGIVSLQGRPRELHSDANSAFESAKIPLFLDSMWRGGGPWYGDVSGMSTDPNFAGIRPPDYNGQWISFNNEMMHFAMDRHDGGVNSAFVDGSVRHVGIRRLWHLKWHKNYEAGRGYVGQWPQWIAAYPDESQAR